MLSYFSDGETTGNTSAVCSLESIWFQAFLSPLNEQMWLMVKLPGEYYFRVVTWFMGSGLKAQNMTGIRAQSKGLRAQKNGIRDHKAFEPESGIRFITRSKNLLSHYFSA